MSNCPPNSHNTHYLNPEIGRLTTPFKHIALAMSGGGSRACAFSLGVLSYLKQVPYDSNHSLLEQVTFMSSASGGTITTSTYAHTVANKVDFGTFYKNLSEHMTGTQLVDRAMYILNDKHAWTNRPAKEQNIINAFALAYNELLFHNATVATLKHNPESHLEEVCFNTTEFHNGLLFRQSVKLKEDLNPQDSTYFLYGNYKLNLKHDTAEHLHIADLLAASSCFPGGFEPIVFPDDFSDSRTSKQQLLDGLSIEIEKINWEELNGIFGEQIVKEVYENMPKPINLTDFLNELNKEHIKNDFYFCMMDGGITDNQGVESMIQANKRRASDQNNFSPFDLMMVCDVDSKWMDPYGMPEKTKKYQWLNIDKLMIGSWALTALLISVILLLSLNTIKLSVSWKASLISISSILLLVTFKVLQTIYSTKRYLVKKSHGKGIGLDKIFNREIRVHIFRFFTNVAFSKLMFMLNVRLTSLLQISNNIFMARIRFLLYDQFFNQNGLKRTGRAKSNHIYDLSFTNDKDRLDEYNTKYQPSVSMQVIAEYAKNMATTLWFSKDGKKRKMQAAITACGQFTTCYNLLDYIEKMKCSYDGQPSIYSQLDASEQKIVTDIETVLSEHFEHFRNDPFWLYNQLGASYGIRDFHIVESAFYDFPKEFIGLRS